jgi:opacity protein-like surface antigen
MKKYSLLIIFAAAPVFAVLGADFSLSAGGGALLGGLFTRYTLTGEGSFDNNPVDVVSTQDMNQFNFGGFVFFDATWVEFSLSVQGGTHTWGEKFAAKSTEKTEAESDKKGTGTEAMLGFTLLGKYPFRLNEQFTVFPLAGIEYQVALFEYRQTESRAIYDRTDGKREFDSNGDPYKISMWNSLFIDIGGGLDFAFYPRMYLRTELLYGFRLMTPYEVDALDKVKKLANAPNPKLAGLTSGPTLKIALGYRFF